MPHEAEMYYVTSSTRIDALRNHLGVSQAKRFNSIQQNAFAVNAESQKFTLIEVIAVEKREIK